MVHPGEKRPRQTPNLQNIPKRAKGDYPKQTMSEKGGQLSLLDVRLNELCPMQGPKDNYETTGIKNMGNTCYLNSVIQVLVNTPIFSEQLLKVEFPQIAATQSTNCAISEELKFITTILQSGEFKSITPVSLKRKIDYKFDRYRGSNQHDAHEFLMELINQIGSEMKLMIPESTAEDLNVFRGINQVNLRCTACLSAPRIAEEQPFNCLHVDIPHNDNKDVESLDECLKSTLKDEILTGEDKENCDICASKQDAARRSMISIPPKILIIHIKRFAYNQKVCYKK